MIDGSCSIFYKWDSSKQRLLIVKNIFSISLMFLSYFSLNIFEKEGMMKELSH